MLTLSFTAEKLALTRFAWSPLAEVLSSVTVLKDPGRHAVHLPWSREARERLATAGVVFPLLSALVPFPAGYLPDFLTPVPETAGATLETELKTVLAITANRVRADLDRMSDRDAEPIRELYRDPHAGLARLAGEIRAYWSCAIEPHWPRMRHLLEGEVLHRARLMALGGAAELFGSLHPQVTWANGTLRIVHTHYRGTVSADAEAGLVLIPSVFVWPGLHTQARRHTQASLAYPARGVAALWERDRPATPGALAKVLGTSRAMLLTELAAPYSTTELAVRTGMPAPTVSHHLTALKAAGLAESHRSGRHVLYLRSAIAEALVLKSAGAGSEL